jgi:hypothetical protein
MLSVGMMNSLSMVFKTNELVDSLMDTSANALRLQQQFERDLSGVTIPTSLVATATDTKKASALDNQSGQISVASGVKKESMEQQKDKNIFLATRKDTNTDFITFITTNPLTSFWSDRAGQAKSRVARVIYRLEPDKENVPLFRLMRQEGMDFDVKKYESGVKNPVRQLEVVRGIKTFSMSFLVEEKPEKKEGSEALKTGQNTKTPSFNKEEAHQKKTITYKSLDEWRGETAQDSTERKKMPKIPRFVQLKVTLMDGKKKREESFEYLFPIISDGEPFAKKEREQSQQGLTPPVKPGGIRQRLMQASNKTKALPGGLLGQFTKNLGVRA